MASYASMPQKRFSVCFDQGLAEVDTVASVTGKKPGTYNAVFDGLKADIGPENGYCWVFSPDILSS